MDCWVGLRSQVFAFGFADDIPVPEAQLVRHAIKRECTRGADGTSDSFALFSKPRLQKLLECTDAEAASSNTHARCAPNPCSPRKVAVSKEATMETMTDIVQRDTACSGSWLKHMEWVPVQCSRFIVACSWPYPPQNAPAVPALEIHLFPVRYALSLLPVDSSRLGSQLRPRPFPPLSSPVQQNESMHSFLETVADHGQLQYRERVVPYASKRYRSHNSIPPSKCGSGGNGNDFMFHRVEENGQHTSRGISATVVNPPMSHGTAKSG